MTQESKPKRVTGVCKRFNPEKGFGFIAVDDGSDDVNYLYSIYSIYSNIERIYT